MRWPWSRRNRKTFSAPKPIDTALLEMKRRTGTTASRDEALSVPAVMRGRNLVCSIATLPLTLLDPARRPARSPLLDQLDPDVPNVVTLAQTLEDLAFEAISWWEITAQDFDGFPVAVRHLDVTSVSVNPPPGATPDPLPSGVDPREAVVWVDGQPVAASRVIRFDSPNPGVLKHAGRAVRRAVLLDKAAGTYADDPRPLDYFSPSDNAEELEDEEVTALLTKWRAARRERSTAFVPASLEYNSVDTPSPQDLQLVELQRQAVLEIAQAMGVDPEDLGLSTTSRTYSNDVDRRRNKLNEVLAPYVRAIEHRLSMGDVTRRGWRVQFDASEFLMPNPSDRWNNYRTALDMGAMTLDEIREAEGMPPLPADAQPAPQPDPEPEGAAASGASTWTFDGGGQLTHVDLPMETFSVDRENRVIEGTALPYGATSTGTGMRFRFEKGALQWDEANPGRVKLLRDHDPGEPLGKAIQLRNTQRGVTARFKVARGEAGDRALELAEDGVLDGLSVGVDFDLASDTAPDPKQRGVTLVRRADWRETSLTAMPSFDGARVTKVAASIQGASMQCTTCGQEHAEGVACPTDTTPAAEPAQTFTQEQVQAMLAAVTGGNVAQPAPAAPAAPAATEGGEGAPGGEGDGGRRVVDPTRPTGFTRVNEALPYRFDRGGNFTQGEHEFSTDLRDMLRSGDTYGEGEPGKRVMGLIQRTFDVQGTDVNELNPNIDRPDMFVPQQPFRYPVWNAINKGSPPNGVQPFTFPKFNSSSGLVGDHTEGTEPSTGSFTTTNQTVTPTPVSGKASITREVWDMGGNPAVSTLIFNQMVRGYREGLENGAATFLNTLTAATDITLTTAAVDDALASDWYAAVAGLQFIRGYDLEVFVLEQVLYETFVAAVGGDNRPLFPQVAPQNTNGTAARRFMTLDLAGIVGVPSWALASTAGSANNSWLFDPEFVHGWATTPQRMEFAGTDSSGDYAPVAYIDLAIWGYEAFANSDIGGVRQVIYDSTT